MDVFFLGLLVVIAIFTNAKRYSSFRFLFPSKNLDPNETKWGWNIRIATFRSLLNTIPSIPHWRTMWGTVRVGIVHTPSAKVRERVDCSYYFLARGFKTQK
ncbi:Schizosaccharomyces pombe specific protein [Schizosaccharomyces pombe]|uniref:Uncharacterized protein C6C3.03c n=1 Tax=Schizosaccharomyces pombe (strain 972 / ATCC 24843) TaxID=284812 RepID=YD53_SCHPO|nr:uncharacterized protein SPAC6C3.03c [Schizosaccharomyces pombe]Q9Y7I3.1 RecName: Full=Uncharacterized protein C6C3.03c [Schizosaccharomyces pombe 972h-]CAB40279.1 sequence orphan [Schizosaccharomyces pombe]|eukprot:NP_001342885.1 uncharacterized protein SPAC6C3.03c [Schizosaccharomyces pombe]